MPMKQVVTLTPNPTALQFCGRCFWKGHAGCTGRALHTGCLAGAALHQAEHPFFLVQHLNDAEKAQSIQKNVHS